MAGSTTIMSIRMDAALGINLSTALYILVRQSLREGKLPFAIPLNQPNKEAVDAVIDAGKMGRDSSAKGDVDEDAIAEANENGA